MSRKQIDGNVDILATTITSADLGALAVIAGKIAAAAIDSASLFVAGVVNAAALATNAVTTIKILANNITLAKMANQAVSAQVLGAGTSGAVTSFSVGVDPSGTPLTAAQMIGGLIIADAISADRNVTTAIATDLWAALTANGIVPLAGTSFYLTVRNNGSTHALALVMGSGVTAISGSSLSTANNFSRTFLFTMTSSTTATCQSIGTQAV